MTQPLEVVFGELGISQYLDAFLDQGFDSWETILDITESDLDVLGVKLGHRRKLQRRIANSRGVAPDASLVSPTQPSIEDPRLDAPRPDGPRTEDREAAVAVALPKRKYRRHPKADDNAPLRPPSAYVLFSNKMREDLKGRNLTFTEIAKLVGEHWQSLSQEEKKPYESQAQAAKDKYNSDLAEYKRTANYKKYTLYLQDFKAKHAHQSQDKDSSKRVKLSEAGSSTPGGGTPGGTPIEVALDRTSRSRSRSSSEGRVGSDPPPPSKPSREPHFVVVPAPRFPPMDEAIRSPPTRPLDRRSLDRRSAERSPTSNPGPRDTPSTTSRPQAEERQNGIHRQLPSLSDMFEHQNNTGPRGTPSSEASGFPFPRIHNSNSPDPPPPLVGGETRPQTLKMEQPSSGSTSSGSSHSYPRTPMDGTLPIHSLLSPKEGRPFEPGAPPLFHASRDHDKPFANSRHESGAPALSNAFPPSLLPISQNRHPALHQYPPSSRPMHPGGSLESSLDGMSALLRAGEIVDRRTP